MNKQEVVKPENVVTEDLSPRKLTVAENVILTIKVLVGFGLLGAALWGLSMWKSGS